MPEIEELNKYFHVTLKEKLMEKFPMCRVETDFSINTRKGIIEGWVDIDFFHKNKLHTWTYDIFPVAFTDEEMVFIIEEIEKAFNEVLAK